MSIVQRLLANDTSFVKAALNDKNCNSKDDLGNSLVHLAIRKNYFEILLLLLQVPKLNINAALYNGHLRLSLLILSTRKECDLYIRDVEGVTCLELLNYTLTKIDKPNFEYLDAKNPAVSVFTWGKNMNYILGHDNADDRAFPERVYHSMSVLQPLVTMVVMSKYHTAILADDKDIYTNGFGRNGRLGLGNEETVLKPTMLNRDYFDSKIVALALGPDHSIVVTSDGCMYTWGSNKYGQLGYVCENRNDENNQLIPKEVSACLKKIKITSAAASKFHTAVISSTGHIYTWGYNLGQLGHHQPHGTLQQYPRKIATFSREVIQVAATNNATAVLLSTKEVYVFANFESHKIIFPSPRVSMIKSYRNKKQHIEKIVSGNHHFVALTNDGEVFMWYPQTKHPTMVNIALPLEQPQKVWSIRKSFLAARDVAIGIDSSLLVATRSGHVFCGVRRKETKFDAKMQKIYYKFSKHVQNVTASQSGGFCALRYDIRPDLVQHNPEMHLRSDLKNYFMLKMHPKLALGPPDEFFDVQFICSDRMINAHRIILSARSPLFYRIFLEDFDDSLLQLEMTMVNHEGGSLLTIKYPHRIDALLLILEYMYAGTLEISSKDAKDIDYIDNVKSLTAMFELIDYDFIYMKCKDTYASDMAKLWMDRPIFDELCNVKVLLADGCVYSHHLFLTARSEFFAALLSGSRWLLLRDPVEDMVVVDLQHIEMRVFDNLMCWLYTDTMISLDKNEFATLEDFINFVVLVLSTSNELLLETVKEMCTNQLISVMDVTNVISILEMADLYEASRLKQSLCWNMETLFETKMLIDLDDALISDLEKNLQAFQLLKFPRTRGENGFYTEVKKRVIKCEEMRKEQRRLDFMRTKLLKVDSKISPFVSPTISFESVDADTIFEMEIEPLPIEIANIDPSMAIKSKSPKRTKWKKLEVHSKGLSPPATAPSPKSNKIWNASPELNGNISLRRIIESESLTSPSKPRSTQCKDGGNMSISRAKPHDSSIINSPASSHSGSVPAQLSNSVPIPAASVQTPMKFHVKMSQKERKKKATSKPAEPLPEQSTVVAEKKSWMPSPSKEKMAISLMDIQNAELEKKAAAIVPVKSIRDIQIEQEFQSLWDSMLLKRKAKPSSGRKKAASKPQMYI